MSTKTKYNWDYISINAQGEVEMSLTTIPGMSFLTIKCQCGKQTEAYLKTRDTVYIAETPCDNCGHYLHIAQPKKSAKIQ
jgi:hypothetical protein